MAVITANQEISKLRISGRISAQALQAVIQAIRPGITTAELNDIAEQTIIKLGGKPAFKGYEGYPFGLCTSVNDEVVHGMPSKRQLENGDIIGLDIGTDYQGIFSDHALTVGVGKIDEKKQRLIDDTEEALHIGLQAVKPGQHIGDIGAAIEGFLHSRGYGIVRKLTGHGLGYAVHEPPSIPNFGKAGTGPEIVVGMVLAIEPMVSLGTDDVVTLEDGWTVATADHQAAAHAEHTILVTKHGYDIITLPS